MSIKRLFRQKIFPACIIGFCSINAIAVDITGSLPERVSSVKAGNKAVVLQGHPVEIDQKAPPFRVIDNNFNPVSLSDFSGNILLISVVPSIDTGVCSLQTKRFNETVGQLPDNVVLVTISTDLPFAQKRYCQHEQIEKMALLSDAVWRDFGSNYGLLIKDMGLLTRTILIIDENGILRYQQLVPVLSHEPDYDAALAALQQLLQSSDSILSD